MVSLITHGRYHFVLATLGCAGLLYCGVSGPARGQSFGISATTITTSSAANPGCGVSTSYTTSGGGSVNPTTGATGCSISESVPVTPGLTSATGQSSAQVFDPADGQPIHPSASATADLSTGSLHAIASFPLAGPSSPGSSSDANWFDNLTFTIAGATASTVTTIPVTFSVDGTATAGYLDGNGTGVPSGPDQGLSLQAGVRIEAGGTPCSLSRGGCGFGTGDLTGTDRWSSDTVATHTVETGSSSVVTWNTPQIDSLTDFTVSGTLSLTGSQPVIMVATDLGLDAGYGALDYSNTASLSLQLPQGVSFTSASGVFGMSVPEPASLTLLATMLAGFGITRRRGRRVA